MFFNGTLQTQRIRSKQRWRSFLLVTVHEEHLFASVFVSSFFFSASIWLLVQCSVQLHRQKKLPAFVKAMLATRLYQSHWLSRSTPPLLSACQPDKGCCFVAFLINNVLFRSLSILRFLARFAIFASLHFIHIVELLCAFVFHSHSFYTSHHRERKVLWIQFAAGRPRWVAVCNVRDASLLSRIARCSGITLNCHFRLLVCCTYFWHEAACMLRFSQLSFTIFCFVKAIW